MSKPWGKAGELRGSGESVRFGHFALDRGQRLLMRDGAPVHLAPKAFELLSILIAAAPRVVTKTELHEQLWPQSYVSDATLTGLVKELRRAVGDVDPAWPIIRTVHRVGYAFCADIQGESAHSPLPTCHWLVAAGRRRLLLHEGENVVGRDPTADVWLDAPSVSRRHARIVVTGDSITVEDLGSKNGTTVGDPGVAGVTALRDGDRLTFGSVTCVYRSSSSGVSTETAHLPQSTRK